MKRSETKRQILIYSLRFHASHLSASDFIEFEYFKFNIFCLFLTAEGQDHQIGEQAWRRRDTVIWSLTSNYEWNTLPARPSGGSVPSAPPTSTFTTTTVKIKCFTVDVSCSSRSQAKNLDPAPSENPGFGCLRL